MRDRGLFFWFYVSTGGMGKSIKSNLVSRDTVPPQEVFFLRLPKTETMRVLRCAEIKISRILYLYRYPEGVTCQSLATMFLSIRNNHYKEKKLKAVYRGFPGSRLRALKWI